MKILYSRETEESIWCEEFVFFLVLDLKYIVYVIDF